MTELCLHRLARDRVAPVGTVAERSKPDGGVLFGIGIALFIESFRKPGGLVGLGLGGAIAINLSGGAVLAGWLIAGGLELPLRGLILLWALAVVLVGISLVELITYRRAAH